jgi:hypothetical protein
MLGRLPYRIDLLTRIDGVSFREAWRGRLEIDIGGQELPVIGRRELIKNKLRAGRPKDLADLVMLEAVGAGEPSTRSKATPRIPALRAAPSRARRARRSR